MSSTARTETWSTHVELLRSKLATTRRQLADTQAELEDTQRELVAARHGRRTGTARAWHDGDGAEEWESLHAGHEILPPDLAA